MRSLRRAEGTTHDSVAIFSGGLDSTTLVYAMLEAYKTPHLLSFDYGQRHSKELEYARKTAKRLNLRHDVIDLTNITHLISNSALTSNSPSRNNDEPNSQGFIDVPEGHYAEDNMKQTVVPNRNMIMLSIAAGVMVNNSYEYLATGVHAGDHFVYPDCRPQFVELMNAAVILGNEGFGAVPKPGPDVPQLPEMLYAPFLHATKEDIAFMALELGVPLHETWSCYKGGEKHCGKCGTCVERLEAIYRAQERFTEGDAVKQYDQTEYEDNTYWKTVTSDKS